MEEEKDATETKEQPRQKKRAGYTKNHGRGIPKAKRKMIKASKRRNRRK